jgi:transposase
VTVCNSAAREFLDWLYYRDGLLCLERKRAKAVETFEAYENKKDMARLKRQKVEVLHLYETTDLSRRDIADAVDADVSTVKLWLRGKHRTDQERVRVQRRRNGFYDRKRREALQIFQQNPQLSKRQIALRIGVPYPTVKTWLRNVQR